VFFLQPVKNKKTTLFI